MAWAPCARTSSHSRPTASSQASSPLPGASGTLLLALVPAAVDLYLRETEDFDFGVEGPGVEGERERVRAALVDCQLAPPVAGLDPGRRDITQPDGRVRRWLYS